MTPLAERRVPAGPQTAGSLQLNGVWHESGCYCAGRTTQRDEGEGGAASCDSCRERPFPTAPRWNARVCVALCNCKYTCMAGGVEPRWDCLRRLRVCLSSKYLVATSDKHSRLSCCDIWKASNEKRSRAESGWRRFSYSFTLFFFTFVGLSTGSRLLWTVADSDTWHRWCHLDP